MTTEELEERYKLLGDIYRKRLADREFYQNELTNDQKDQKSLADQAKEQPDNDEVKKKLAAANDKVSDDEATIKACDAWVKEAREARDEFRGKHPKIAEGIDQEDRDRAAANEDRKQFKAEKEAAVQKAAGHDPDAIPAQGDNVLQGPMAKFAAAGLAVAAMWNANAQTLDAVQDGLRQASRPAIERPADQSPAVSATKEPSAAEENKKEQVAKAREQGADNAQDLDEQLHKLDESKEPAKEPSKEPSKGPSGGPSGEAVPPPTRRTAREVAGTESKPPADDPDHRWSR